MFLPIEHKTTIVQSGLKGVIATVEGKQNKYGYINPSDQEHTASDFYFDENCCFDPTPGLHIVFDRAETPLGFQAIHIKKDEPSSSPKTPQQ